MEETILSTVKEWGVRILDFLIDWADKIERWGWDTAHEALRDLDKLKRELGPPSEGLLSGVADLLKLLASTIGAALDYLKAGAGYGIYGVSYGAKALLCMLRSAQSKPGYLDYSTYVGVWTVRYLWKTVKQIRLSSPDFLGVQTVGADLEDFVDGVLTVLERSLTQQEPPHVPDAMEAFLNNKISPSMYACWMRLNDVSPEVWQPVLESRREQLTTVEQMEFVRRVALGRWGAEPSRAGITPGELETEEKWKAESIAALRNVGWIHQEEASAAEALYDELPTIADHLHWLARNVDDTEYVRDYHLLDGFDTPEVVSGMVSDPNYRPVGSSLGRNFWREFGPELRAQGMRKIDAARHYAAHWLHPSPQQMREFVFRLRPGRPESEYDAQVKEYFKSLNYPSELVERATTFSPDDFRRLMAEQDYGYLDVGWFLATLYHVPALSYIRDMYRYGVINEDELQSYHQDLGYSERDSKRFVGVDRSIKARIRASESAGWTPASLARALGLGLITKEFDAGEMHKQGFSDAEIASHQSRASVLVRERVLTRALGRVISRTIAQVTSTYAVGGLTRDGARAALVNLGIQAAQADSILTMEDMRFQTNLLKQNVSALKKQFLKGRIDAGKAVELLSAAGMQQPFVDRTVAAWKLQLSGPARELGAAEVRRAVVDGIISPQEASLRLTNLGYSADDVAVILAEVQRLVLTAEEREAAGQERQQLAQARRAEAAVKAAERAKQAAIREQMRQAPPARLARWLARGIITKEQFAEQLASYGFDAATIERMTSDALGTGKVGDKK